MMRWVSTLFSGVKVCREPSMWLRNVQPSAVSLRIGLSVVGVAEDDLRADVFAQVAVMDALDGTDGPDRHEYRGMDLAVVRLQDARTGGGAGIGRSLRKFHLSKIVKSGEKLVFLSMQRLINRPYMNKSNIGLRLILMNFLEFAAWGAYLTSMGSFLARSGFGPQIWLFFATQGFVSIFMPALMGIVADKWIPAQKVLSLCQGVAGLSMLAAGWYAMSAGANIQFGTFYALYTLSIAFFMPTIAISNSVAYNALEKNGKDPVKAFPPIRVFGTIGFILTMLFVNFVKGADGVQFQHTYNQFFVSGILSLALCLYALTLPDCPCKPRTAGTQSFAEATGLSAFRLFKDRQFAVFFIFSMLLGASLQITNGYANTFLGSFAADPSLANTFAVKNSNALIAISQASETLCILLIPFAMKRFGIKNVMLIAMFAWVGRFAFFGLGNPAMPGVLLFVLSCIVYGFAFDFFNISGSLYVEQNAPQDIRSSAQGLFMMMTNGFGATIGTLAAGAVVDATVYKAANPSWPKAWYIFAAYAFVVGILFMILFKDPQKKQKAA